jgi:hypothetical protein
MTCNVRHNLLLDDLHRLTIEAFPGMRRNHGMQRSGGGGVSRSINVNSRRPLIPVVIGDKPIALTSAPMTFASKSTTRLMASERQLRVSRSQTFASTSLIRLMASVNPNRCEIESSAEIARLILTLRGPFGVDNCYLRDLWRATITIR